MMVEYTKRVTPPLTPPPAPLPARINLSKGDTPVSLSKGARISAMVSWPDATDYDLGAEVLYVDGTSESIAQFGANGLPARTRTTDGGVVQTGDAQRGSGGMASERLEIVLNDRVLAVVPWAYSAQSNGTGSFRRYSVSMEVTDGSQTIRIDARNASSNDRVYTCVPGMITNLPGEGPRVHYLELYSKPTSELRPKVKFEAPRGVFGRTGTGEKTIQVDPNGGPRNKYK